MLELLAFENPVWEMVLRGSAVYWFLFVLFRFVLRRDVRSMGVADLLFVVLVADAASNAMQGDYKSLGDGMVLVATLAAWNFSMDWLGFHSALIGRLMEPTPEVLVRNGKPNHRLLARLMMSVEELQGKLRAQGVESISDVRVARIESDGALSVFTFDDCPRHKAQEDRNLPPGGG